MFGFVSGKKYEAALDRAERVEGDRENLAGRLNALRANCFITNERGHRVRYINASAERRAKAEGRGS